MISAGLHQRAEREDQQAARAFAADLRAADRQRRHLRDRRDARTLSARITHRHRTRRCVVAVYSICRHSFSSAGAMTVRFGNAAQERIVVAALVRGAIAADEAGAIEREDHRQVLQRHVVDQLVVGALQERGVDSDHRLPALAGEAGRERDGMLFGDGDVEITLRKFLRVFDHARAFAHGRA